MVMKTSADVNVHMKCSGAHFIDEVKCSRRDDIS